MKLRKKKFIHGPMPAGARIPGVPGGTGHRFPWRLGVEAKRFGKPIIVAGGLTPENVRLCVEMTQPYGVDVSTGV